jgi:hypothetical protein
MAFAHLFLSAALATNCGMLQYIYLLTTQLTLLRHAFNNSYHDSLLGNHLTMAMAYAYNTALYAPAELL